MRILVTGSRDWSDEGVIWKALDDAIPVATTVPVTIVHGDCPTGADAIADRLSAEWGCAVEAHPADWRLGRKAGPLRNAEMVAASADLCLAFISNGSRGATDCANKAESAGIETRRFVAGGER